MTNSAEMIGRSAAATRPSEVRATEKTAIDTLLEAAILAPSGDNTQPWRFAVDQDHGSITIDADPSRDPSPMNAGQRMAWIAIGAAIENMVRTADKNGWRYQLESGDGNGPAILRLEGHPGPGTIDPMLIARVSNRRVYDGGKVPPESLDRLQIATSEIDGVKAHWISDPALINRLIKLIARADALILGTKPIRDAFLAKVRFDQPADAAVDEGLSLGCLEASAAERFMLRLMRYVPDGILRPLGGRAVFAGVATKLATSASGFCLVSAPENSLATRIPVGRVWQQAWLALTEQGLASQPMMSLCVLQSMRDNAPAELLDRIGADRAEMLLRETEAIFREIFDGQIAAIMRFGFAAEPSSRVGRRALVP